MADDIKIIEFESTEGQKGKKVLFISLIAVTAVLAVVFMLLWILTPAGNSAGKVHEVSFSNTAVSGQTLAEDSDSGKTVYLASAGNSYSFSAFIVGDGGIGILDWDISPADRISGFRTSADPANPANILCEFTAGTTPGIVKITAKANGKEVGSFSFEIRAVFAESLTISSVQSAHADYSFALGGEGGSRTVTLPHFSETYRGRYNLFSVKSALGSKFDLSAYEVNGMSVNALRYSLQCADGSIRLTDGEWGGASVGLEVMKPGGSAVLQIRANQNGPAAQNDYLTEIAINTVPHSDSSMRFILSSITLTADAVRNNPLDEYPTVEIFLNGGLFPLRNTQLDRIETVPAAPPTGTFSLKSPREVNQNGEPRTNGILNSNNLTAFGLSASAAGETFVLLEDAAGGFGARFVFRVIVYKRVAELELSGLEKKSGAYELPCQAGAASGAVKVRYTVADDGARNTPASQVKSALYFYYPSVSLQPGAKVGAFTNGDKELFKHTAVVLGMRETGETHPQIPGLKKYTFNADLKRIGEIINGNSVANLLADLSFFAGDNAEAGNIVFNFFLGDQFHAAPALQAVTLSVGLQISKAVQGLRFDFENFNRKLTANAEPGTNLYATDNGKGIWESSLGGGFARTATLFRNTANANAAASFNLFDLLQCYDITGNPFKPNDSLLQTAVPGISIERLSGPSLEYPIKLTTGTNQYRFIGRVEDNTTVYKITVDSENRGGASAVSSGELILTVQYRNATKHLTLQTPGSEEFRREIPYRFDPKNLPSLSNLTFDRITRSFAYGATTETASHTGANALSLSIFVGGNSMLYQKDGYYYDFSAVDNPDSPDPQDALFIRGSDGTVKINRDLYLYSRDRVSYFTAAGKTPIRYDEFELLYTQEPLASTVGELDTPAVTVDQQVRGFTVDRLMNEISGEARAKYRAVRLFDEIGFFNNADERQTGTAQNPIIVTMGHTERFFAYGIVYGFDNQGMKNDEWIIRQTSDYTDSLSAVGSSGSVESFSPFGSAGYRFVPEDETGETDTTAVLSVSSQKGGVRTEQLHFLVKFRIPMPVYSIEVFSNEERTAEVDSAADPFRLSNYNPGKSRSVTFYLTVSYDGTEFGSGQGQMNYDTFDGIALSRVGGSGEQIVTAAYSDGSNNMMQMTPEAGGYAGTEISALQTPEGEKTLYIRRYAVTLTAAPLIADKTESYRFRPRHRTADQEADSETFGIRVTSYAERLEVHNASGVNITQSGLLLTMKGNTAPVSAVVSVKQLAGNAVLSEGVYQTVKYDYRILTPDGSGDFNIHNDNLVVIPNSNPTGGEFTVRSNSQVAESAIIRFFVIYCLPGTETPDPYIESKFIDLPLTVTAEVFDINLDTSALDPDGLHGGKLPIVVYGQNAAKTHTQGEAVIRYNGGDSAFAPSLTRFSIAVTVRKNGVVTNSYPFEIEIKDNAVLWYRIANWGEGINYADLQGYSVLLTVTNTATGSQCVQSFALHFETAEFDIAVTQVNLGGDAEKPFVYANGRVSLFTAVSAKVAFVTVVKNTWTGEVLQTSGTLIPLPIITYSATAAEASAEFENAEVNLLTIKNSATEEFTVFATAANGAGEKNAAVAVSKFNRIAAIEKKMSAPVKPAIVATSEITDIEYTLTLVKSGASGGSVDLSDYFAAVGINGPDGEIIPFTHDIAVSASGAAVHADGYTVSAAAAGTAVLNLTAVNFQAYGFTDAPIPPVRILMTVTELSLAVQAAPIQINLGSSDTFTFSFTGSTVGAGSLSADSHNILYKVTEKNGEFIDLMTESNPVAGSYTVTIVKLKKDLGETAAIEFYFTLEVDGVTITVPFTLGVTLFTGSPSFALIKDGTTTEVRKDPTGTVYQADYLVDPFMDAKLSGSAAIPGTVLGQIAQLGKIIGMNIGYSFVSTDPNILRIEKANTASPRFVVVKSPVSDYGAAEIWLTLTVSGKEFTYKADVDVFNSARITAKVFTGGIFDGTNGKDGSKDNSYVLASPVSVVKGGTVSADHTDKIGQSGPFTAPLVYLFAAYNQDELTLSATDFSLSSGSFSLAETGVKGFMTANGEYGYFVQYRVQTVAAELTDVTMRASARIGLYDYTDNFELVLSAVAPKFDYQDMEEQDGILTVVPNSVHQVFPIRDSAFLGGYKAAYEWFDYNGITPGTLTVSSETGELKVNPMIGSGTVKLRITVFIESGAFQNWSDAGLQKTITIAVESAGAPIAELVASGKEDVERAESGSSVTVDLFDGYIRLTDYDPEHLLIAPTALEVSYGAKSEVRFFTVDPEDSGTKLYADLFTEKFFMQVPNRVFYAKVSFLIEITGGQWEGFQKTLTVEFFVVPEVKNLVLSGDAKVAKSVYTVGSGADTAAVNITAVPSGGTVVMDAAPEETLYDSQFMTEGEYDWTLDYSVAVETPVPGDAIGSLSPKSHRAGAIGSIEGNRFVTNRGAGGIVRLYATVKFHKGPFVGRDDYSFEKEVFVLALQSKSDTIDHAAPVYSIAGDGIYVRSGKSVDLAAVLQTTGSSSAFERIPANGTESGKTLNAFTNAPVIEASATLSGGSVMEKITMNDSVLSVAAGAYYKGGSVTGSSVENTSLTVNLTMTVERYSGDVSKYETHSFTTSLRLYLMPEELPVVSVTGDSYKIAETVHTGTPAALYAGDTVIFTVSAAPVTPITQIDLYLQKGAEEPVMVASVSGSGLNAVSYQIPDSLAAGIYKVFVKAVVAGFERTSADYAKTIAVTVPTAFSAAGITSVMGKEQMVEGSGNTLLITAQAGKPITRIRFTVPAGITNLSVKYNGGSAVPVTPVKMPGGEFVIDFTPLTPATDITLSFESNSAVKAVAYFPVTVFTDPAAAVSRYTGGAVTELLGNADKLSFRDTNIQARSEGETVLVLTGTGLKLTNIESYTVTSSSPFVTIGALDTTAGTFAVSLNGNQNVNFQAAVTLVSYTVAGRLVTVDSAITINFVPAPVFTLTADNSNNSFKAASLTGLSDSSFEIIGYTVVSGGAHIVSDSAAGSVLTISPRYDTAATNKISLRVLVKVTADGIYKDAVFETPAAELSVQPPNPVPQIVEQNRGSGLKLSGDLAVTNYAGASFGVPEADRAKFAPNKYPGYNGGAFEFLQSASLQTVPVTVTVVSGSLTYVTVYMLTNYAVPAPEFSLSAHALVSGRIGFDILNGTGIGYSVTLAAVPSESEHVTDLKTTGTNPVRVSFIPRFSNIRSNLVTVMVRITVASPDSPYHGATYILYKDIQITSAVPVTEKARWGQFDLSGGFNYTLSGAAIAFSTADSGTYFSSFNTATGDYTFRQSVTTVTRTILATVTKDGATYLYYFDVTNEAVAGPEFTVSRIGGTYSFRVTGSVGGQALDMRNVEAEFSVIMGSGHVVSGSFTTATAAEKVYTVVPRYIHGENNKFDFRITLTINAGVSVYSGIAYAQSTGEITVTNAFAGINITDNRAGTTGTQVLSGEILVANTAGGTVLFVTNGSDQNKFSQYAGTGGSGNGVFSFKESANVLTATVFVTVTHTATGGVYEFAYTLTQNPFDPAMSFTTRMDTAKENGWFKGNIEVSRNGSAVHEAFIAESDRGKFATLGGIPQYPSGGGAMIAFEFVKNTGSTRWVVPVVFKIQYFDGSRQEYTHYLINEPFPEFELVDSRDGVNGWITVRSDLVASPLISVSFGVSGGAGVSVVGSQSNNPLQLRFDSAYEPKSVTVTANITLAGGSDFPGAHPVITETVVFDSSATFAIETVSDTMIGGRLRLTAFNAGETAEFSFSHSGGLLSFGPVENGIVDFTKNNGKAGGLVDVTVTMTYGGGLTVIRSIQIYVAPATPILELIGGSEKLVGGVTEVSFRVKNTADEYYTLNTNTLSHSVTIVSGNDIYVENAVIRSVTADAESDILTVGFTKLTTPISGLSMLQITVQLADSANSGVVVGHYLATTEATQIRLAALDSTATGSYMQRTYQLQIYQSYVWNAFTIPANWSVTYDSVMFTQNGSHLYIQTNVSNGKLTMTYWYNYISPLSSTVKWQVLARTSANMKGTVLNNFVVCNDEVSFSSPTAPTQTNSVPVRTSGGSTATLTYNFSPYFTVADTAYGRITSASATVTSSGGGTNYTPAISVNGGSVEVSNIFVGSYDRIVVLTISVDRGWRYYNLGTVRHYQHTMRTVGTNTGNTYWQ